MKILNVMGGFFPGKKYGGPPVSIDNFCSLMKEYACYIVTHNHDLFETEKYSNIDDGWNDRGNCKVLYLSDSEYNKRTFEKVMEEIKPDVLYMQGLFQSCVFPCLQLAKKRHLKVLLAPRGELCAGALHLKKQKKVPYIYLIKALGLTRNLHFQSTSEEETEAIKKWLKVSDDKIHMLDNIPSIPSKEYPRRVKQAGEGRFVFLSRIHPKKNLLSAIRYFHTVQGQVIFDIYGPIEDEAYWQECEEEIKKLPDHIHVKYCGLVSHEQVHEVFSRYDAFLFPTLSENYGHVIAESLMVGTPVIISDQTPWRYLREANAGWDIPLSDKSSFVAAVNAVVAADSLEQEKMTGAASAYALEKLNIEGLREKYSTILKQIVQ